MPTRRKACDVCHEQFDAIYQRNASGHYEIDETVCPKCND